MSRLRSKQTRLRGLMTSFNGIYNFMQQYDEQQHSGELASRLEKLEPLWEKIDSVMMEAEIADSEDDGVAERYAKDRADFQNKYFAVKGFLQSKLRELPHPDAALQIPNPPMNESAAIPPSHPHVKLPMISLPKFSGKIEEWLSFRDLYLSLIHLSTELPEIEKFHYLRSQLEGEALAVISSLPLTQANYNVAWNLLVKRFSDSKILKKKQIQNLFDLPSARRESASDLHRLIDGFERSTKVLDQMVEPAEYKDLLLVHLLSSRLDDKTRRSWEEHSSTLEKESFKNIMEFLRRRIQVLESLPSKQVEPHPSMPKRPTQIKTINHGSIQSSSQSVKCVSCSESHPLFTCPAFGRLSVADREKVLRQHNLCRNCFRKGHQARECPSKFSCKRCRERHHTLVCFKPEEKSRVAVQTGALQVPPDEGASSSAVERPATYTATESTTISSNLGRTAKKVLLATAIVLVVDDHGNEFPARALLDSGSECNIVSTFLSQKLRVSRSKANVNISGVGQVPSMTKEKFRATVKSRLTDFAEAMEFYVLSKVTENLPTSSVDTTKWIIPPGVQLADPEYFRTNTIDVLLGGEFFFNFFPSKQRLPLGEGLPTLVESVFGWLVTGRCGLSRGDSPIVCQHSIVSDSLERLMTKFWECEDGTRGSTYSVEENECEAHFVSTVKRGEDGRYTVSLPKSTDSMARLGESKSSALRRLMSLERRLNRDEPLRTEYHAFINDYIERGHMRKIVDENSDPSPAYYLPHHPVVKESSTTTRVRVVFDASSKTSTGLSLNDVLLNGPVIQDDLRTIIMRSRLHPIILIADVEKMFRQIRMDPSDFPLQRILWRFSPDDPVDTYELLTVTYGTKPAPFLATRILKQLSVDEALNYPLAAQRIAKDVYMDDVITGVQSVEEAVAVRKQLDGITQAGGLRLRKWVSNVDEALEGVEETNLAIPREQGIDFGERTVKTLGLVWEPRSDTFRFKIQIPPSTEAEWTKRKVLSNIAKVFDPLGLIGPVVTSAKIIMQQVWELKDEKGKAVGWDDTLPKPLMDTWGQFFSQLPKLDNLRIPRFVLQTDPIKLQLHYFCDASERAYGACAYARSLDSDGLVKISLITSKSRVAPLKRQTIPRLELCGARLAVELHQKVAESFNIPYEAYFWTDSRTVLQWLGQPPSTWTTFVAHRVAFIQTNTQGCYWNHVPGVQNPADQLSRGLDPGAIVERTEWWNGPPWLIEDQDLWPSQQAHLPEPDEPELERKKTVATLATIPQKDFSDWFLDRFSSYSALLRTTAYCKRFASNLRTPKKERLLSVPLTTKELREAELSLVRLVQQKAFPRELQALSRSEAVHRSSKLRWFHPMLSPEGIICVGGRLEHSDRTEEAKHPMVIPGDHQFSKLLATSYHLKLLHAGTQLMLSSMRLRFWPLGGRNLCRLTTHRCLTCYRAKPKLQQQFMGQLPAPRILAARPFSNTGVDYFGPVYIRQGYRSGPVKAYVSVFICLGTKAIHLELVSDLSTARFIQALRRFTSRRGFCSNIYSDNGTNFVGARNEMKELLKNLKNKQHHAQIQDECRNDGVNWHFIPPGAPHFGGLWEAAVRSAKGHLLRVLGNSSASHEDFLTLLAQVEGCLNSRPLTQLTDDPTDLQPLTPAHFLVGSSLQALPDKDYTGIQGNRLTHWQAIQQQLQHFWRRWHTEYLAQLQARVKNWQPAINIEPGRLVIVVDENQPSMKWKMARIHQVHPGSDGVVRVVTLRTASGYLKRPVTKICLLPLPTSTPDTAEDSTQGSAEIE